MNSSGNTTSTNSSNPMWPNKDPTARYSQSRENRVYDILAGAGIAGTAYFFRTQIPEMRRPDTSALSGSLKNHVEYLYRNAYVIAQRHRALMTGMTIAGLAYSAYNAML